jgi:hypothetical protein
MDLPAVGQVWAIDLHGALDPLGEHSFMTTHALAATD